MSFAKYGQLSVIWYRCTEEKRFNFLLLINASVKSIGVYVTRQAKDTTVLHHETVMISIFLKEIIYFACF